MLRPLLDVEHVFDAGDLPQQLFHRIGNALLYFFRTETRRLHKDVDHRHDDLRLLLARRLQQGKAAQQQRSNNQQRRQLRVDKETGTGDRLIPR